jgi:parallel beta-helix repeat protein/predicted outer membrane repeat protein
MNSPKTKILILTFLSFISTMDAQTIVTGGYISGDWDVAHSPYLVEGDLLIHPDSTLTIGAGTIISFNGHYRLEIQGQLLVQGTSELPVNFVISSGIDYWDGIQFITTDTSITDSSIMEHGVISNCNQFACLNITNSSRLRVSDFTIQYGDSFRGGGIRCSHSDPLFESLLIQNNIALDGAGISLEQSNPILRNCIISNNSADGAGGGMVIFGLSAPILENCTISGNYSYGSGGGIYINDAYPIFRRCLICGNDGAQGSGNLYSGGGVSVKLDSYPYFENCSFASNNSLHEGGAIASFSPTELINCLFLTNSAVTSGGGVFLSSANLIVSHLTNCTFSDNDSPLGMALAAHNHTAVVRNCIMWHSAPANPASLIYLDATFLSDLLNAGYSDLQNGQAGIELYGNAQIIWVVGNIDLDPEFLPDSRELSWQSPCIEAGTPDTTGLMLPEKDLAGNPRFANERVDMGSYEYQFPVLVQSSRFKVQSEFRVYPDPARDRVYIERAEEMHEATYQLLNGNNQVVVSGKIGTGVEKFGVGISGLADGIYLIMIYGDDFHFTKKIIIHD